MVGDRLIEAFRGYFAELCPDDIFRFLFEKRCKCPIAAADHPIKVFDVNWRGQDINQVLNEDFVVGQCLGKFLSLAGIAQNKCCRI